MKTLLKAQPKENIAGGLNLADDDMNADGSPFSFEPDPDVPSFASQGHDDDGQPADSSQVPQSSEGAEQQAETSEVVALIGDTAYGRKEEERFHELVILRASRKATEEQQREFAVLQDARRAALQPDSTDAILQEYRRQQFFLDALQVLSRHAKFLEPANQARHRTSRSADRQQRPGEGVASPAGGF